jgi:hypothetical protein
MRFFSLLLLAAAAAAVAHATSIESDPYTLSDGTVVDPTDSQSSAAAEERSTDSIYTTLSHGGPMGGMGGRQLRH